MNICTEFEEHMSILCLVIIWTRFGRYIIKLKAAVTLTLHRLLSKSIGIIYTQRKLFVPNLTNLGEFCVLVIIWTRLGLYINMFTVTVAMTFDQLTEMNVCAKFDEQRSILCLAAIIQTRLVYISAC